MKKKNKKLKWIRQINDWFGENNSRHREKKLIKSGINKKPKGKR